MLRLIKKGLKRSIGYIYCKTNPVGYAKSIGVKLGNNVHFYGANPHMFSTEPWIITIGDNVHITSDVLFLTHDGGTLILPEIRRHYILTGRINIGSNSYIGTRSIIFPGVNIGDNCIIGAGSIVTKDIPDNSVAAGVPARVINSIDGYAAKIRKAINGDLPQYFESLEAVRAVDPQKRYNS